MASIKPFHFRLKKISNQQLRLTEGLLNFLPRSGLKEDLQVGIRKTLHHYLSEVGFFLEKIEEISFKDFFTGLPSPCGVAVLSCEPFAVKGFVAIDPLLSHLMIEKLLGGKGSSFGELRPLTETEQGVIEFLLLKLLAQIHRLSGEKAKLHFRLEKMVLEPSHLKGSGQENEALVCLKFHLSFLNHSGFINLYLPHPWVLEGFLQGLPEAASSEEQKELNARLAAFTDFPCEVWVSLGEATLSATDLQSLETGDVVLFDRAQLRQSGGAWQGEVHLHVGKGEQGGFVARWEGFKSKEPLHLVKKLKGGEFHG